MANEKARPWNPLTPNEIANLLSGAPFRWWIAGGIAIEFAAGRGLRSHTDIDVLVLRRDAAQVRARMSGWDCWMADPPGKLRPWPVAESLPAAAHDVWCRQDRGDDWRLQFMFDESDGETWQSRRAAQISRPLSELGIRDGSGIPFLRPEIVLFYKAKAPRPRDEIDFEAVRTLLDAAARGWLAEAIATAYRGDHPWIARLAC